MQVGSCSCGASVHILTPQAFGSGDVKGLLTVADGGSGESHKEFKAVVGEATHGAGQEDIGDNMLIK